MKRVSLAIVLIAALCAYSFGSADEFSSKTIQIGMIVSDMDASLHFYKKVVGMVQVDQARFDVDADFSKRSGLTDGRPIHVEILKLGSGADATQLKLLHLGSDPIKQENEFIHTHTGVQYLTINVTNLAPIVERIKENNIPLLGETPVSLGEERDFVLIKDPDGTFVELIGPMEILPPSQYEIMKEKSNFDRFNRTTPYRTAPRSAAKEEKSSKKFNFFGLFGSKKDKAATEETKTVTQEDEAADSESKEIRNKFKRFNRNTSYKTPTRKEGSGLIP